jgi:hypothetical protein
MTDIPEPPQDAAESRAIELLRLVGTRTPSVRPGFTSDVVSRARVQRAFATPLRALGGLVTALAAALGSAVRGAGGMRRRP